MEEKLFLEKSILPSDDQIRIGLGKIYQLFEKLKVLLSGFSFTWTFTKSSGWMLKYHDNKKALLYLIPMRNEFKVSLTLRENEKSTTLRERLLEDGMLTKIESAKKYVEGYAIQLMISKNIEYVELTKLINGLQEIRRKS